MADQAKGEREFARNLMKSAVRDLVEIRNHQVSVNGQPVNEPYIEAPPQYVMTSQRVMPGNYFVLGDNRNNSSDSHVWGQVAWYYIIGQAWVSYWPLGDWQFFPS